MSNREWREQKERAEIGEQMNRATIAKYASAVGGGILKAKVIGGLAAPIIALATLGGVGYALHQFMSAQKSQEKLDKRLLVVEGPEKTVRGALHSAGHTAKEASKPSGPKPSLLQQMNHLMHTERSADPKAIAYATLDERGSTPKFNIVTSALEKLRKMVAGSSGVVTHIKAHDDDPRIATVTTTRRGLPHGVDTPAVQTFNADGYSRAEKFARDGQDIYPATGKPVGAAGNPMLSTRDREHGIEILMTEENRALLPFNPDFLVGAKGLVANKKTDLKGKETFSISIRDENGRKLGVTTMDRQDYQTTLQLMSQCYMTVERQHDGIRQSMTIRGREIEPDYDGPTYG